MRQSNDDLQLCTWLRGTSELALVVCVRSVHKKNLYCLNIQNGTSEWLCVLLLFMFEYTLSQQNGHFVISVVLGVMFTVLWFSIISQIPDILYLAFRRDIS